MFPSFGENTIVEVNSPNDAMSEAEATRLRDELQAARSKLAARDKQLSENSQLYEMLR